MNSQEVTDKKRQYLKEYYQRNKERLKENAQEYRRRNPERSQALVREWHADPKNSERIAEYRKQYYKDHREKILSRSKARVVDPALESERQRLWRVKHKDKHCAKNAKYRASRIKRTPRWLTDDDKWMISEIYELAALRTKMTGMKWHVDHIIPLNGKIVSGLHVPENMQVIPSVLNFRKHNQFA